MKINDLNIIAQRLGAFGKEHLGIDPRGHTVPTTSSLGGRIVNWIRSRHSDTAAQANRDVMDGLINTIRQTDDLGDRFADIARKSLEDKLAAGRPLSGRDAARVLRDVIRIKTTEDQARLESRLINVRDQFQKLCAPHADGSPSDLETQIAARRQRFGLPPATAEQFQVYRDTALRDLEARARRADHSLTPAESLDALLSKADYITIHTPQTPETKGLINADRIRLMKKGVRLINLARGGLVVNSDILAAIDEGKIAAYISDFADEAMLANNKVVCLPHLGASTPEAEDNCAKMAVKQVMAFMEEGTITNSVNFPKCRMDEPVPQNGARLAIANKNVPNMIGQITSVLAANKLNISSMANQNRNDVAYNLIDVETPVPGDVVNSLLAIDGKALFRACIWQPGSAFYLNTVPVKFEGFISGVLQCKKRKSLLLISCKKALSFIILSPRNARLLC